MYMNTMKQKPIKDYNQNIEAVKNEEIRDWKDTDVLKNDKKIKRLNKIQKFTEKYLPALLDKGGVWSKETLYIDGLIYYPKADSLKNGKNWIKPGLSTLKTIYGLK